MFNAKPGVMRNALSPGRVEALTDGVFAIVMTILVLELGVPLVTGGSVSTELPHRLLEMWPKFVSYAITFLMLGFMWSIHHYQFNLIRRSDSVLVWINLVFLMLVSLLPFSTSMLGEYIGETAPVLIIGGHFSICMIMRYGMWSYATGRYRLVDRDIDPRQVSGPKVMFVTGVAVFMVGMGVSFVSTIAAVCIFAAMIALFIVRSSLLNRVRVADAGAK